MRELNEELIQAGTHFKACVYVQNVETFIEGHGVEVVEFALSRSLSPTMVSEYNLKLIDKALLQKKLKEYIELADTTSE